MSIKEKMDSQAFLSAAYIQNRVHCEAKAELDAVEVQSLAQYRSPCISILHCALKLQLVHSCCNPAHIFYK